MKKEIPNQRALRTLFGGKLETFKTHHGGRVWADGSDAAVLQEERAPAQPPAPLEAGVGSGRSSCPYVQSHGGGGGQTGHAQSSVAQVTQYPQRQQPRGKI